jgi:hypothetical protein
VKARELAAYKLVTAEHTTVDNVEVYGRRVWLRCLMIAARVWSVIPPYFLGRIDRGTGSPALAVSTASGSATGGPMGSQPGVISFEIVKDGYVSLRNSTTLLMNHRPTTAGTNEKDPVVDRVCEAMEGLAWVEAARVGETFAVPRYPVGLVEKLEQASDLVHALDWQLNAVQLVPVRSLDGPAS